MKIKFLLNPFEKIAGFSSLLWGFLAMIAAGIIGFTSHTHFDGVLNVHSGYIAPLWFHMIEPFLNWIFISLWFLVWGFILSKSKIRTIDIIGTQAFAFIPLFPASFSGYFSVVEELSKKLSTINPENFTIDTLPMHQLVGVVIIAFVIMFLVVWSAIWMYKGYKISSNLTHSRVIPVYATGIILGMILPKYIMSLFN